MDGFKNFVFNEQPLPPPGGPAGGLGLPASLPPALGGMGGMPGLGGGGMGGGGMPPLPPPPLGGGGIGGGLGGPPMPGMPGQQQAQVMKLDSPDVWKILEKLLHVEK